jgi:hypothetical protein
MGSDESERPKSAQVTGGVSGTRKRRPWIPPVLIQESLPSSTGLTKANRTPPEFDNFKGPSS